MTRVDGLIIGGIALFLALSSLVVGFIWLPSGPRLPRLLFATAVLLIPGRVQGLFYRDLFRGRRLLVRRELADSAAATRRFLDWIDGPSWRRALLWLTWSVYTTDARAMGWNNLGVAEMQRGRWNAAAQALHQALAIDPKYPIPHFNLAAVAHILGDRETCETHAAAAKSLGHRNTTRDRIIDHAQYLLAELEGGSVGS